MFIVWVTGGSLLHNHSGSLLRCQRCRTLDVPRFAANSRTSGWPASQVTPRRGSQTHILAVCCLELVACCLLLVELKKEHHNLRLEEAVS